MKKIIRFSLYVMLFVVLAACVREPPLHLHRGQHIDSYIPIVELDLDVFWDYDAEVAYQWRNEWTYGWDEEDLRLFGPVGYTKPKSFDIRRYFLQQPRLPHTKMEPFDLINSTHFEATYDFGYYDLLVWNKIDTPDGVLSVVFDEQTTLDSVMAYTNNAQVRTRYDRDFHNSPSAPKYSWGSPNYNYAFYEPEEVFSAYDRDIYISRFKEDYDAYDEEKHIYYKYLDMLLMPVTYIYLTQVRLHHNKGRIDGVDGNANISGMARGACLNSGLSAHDPITVNYKTRFKKGVKMNQLCHHINHGVEGEQCQTVDIAGGRVVTFGIPNQNSSRVSRAEDVKDDVRHYLDVTMLFNNGLDSTFVFDVTDQVRKRYRGGVITIDLDVDTIPIPSRSGGSGFDAEVEDWEEETHEFPMGNKPRRDSQSGAAKATGAAKAAGATKPTNQSSKNNNKSNNDEKPNIFYSSCGDDPRKLYKRQLPW